MTVQAWPPPGVSPALLVSEPLPPANDIELGEALTQAAAGQGLREAPAAHEAHLLRDSAASRSAHLPGYRPLSKGRKAGEGEGDGEGGRKGESVLGELANSA